MKKIYLLGLFAYCSMGIANAQLSEGGIPWSIQNQKTDIVNRIEYPAPDFKTIIEKEHADEMNGVSKPYMVSTFVPTDISLQNSGTWTFLGDGSKIWRLQVYIPDAKAIDFMYDQFNLPEGVRLYLSNLNGQQLIGAYTDQNNDPSGLFTNQAVQGDLVNLEMNIPATVEVSHIKFHINKAGAYYRGVNELTQYFGKSNSATPAKPTIDESSPCHINATCPVAGEPQDYLIPRNATVKITIVSPQGDGFCSGTLINNTDNSENGTCRNLLLTASHCDQGNNRDDASFAQWKFSFNYQYDSCSFALHTTPGTQTLTGAKFRSRSNLPSFPPNNPQDHSLHLVADFLLLELNSTIPQSYGAYLAGWNRGVGVIEDPAHYNFFIGFHHPMGDIKKKSTGVTVQGNGTFNQNTVPGTHFYIPFQNGGSEPGSSGSGLFDVDGRIIGDLSGGTSISSTCGAEYGTAGLYSKISYGWENDFDQTEFPTYAGAQSRLKDWLDPAGIGIEILDPATATDCTPLGIKEVKEELGQSINVYPNPSSTGKVYAKVNFKAPVDLKITVLNALGAVQKEFYISKAQTGEYQFDCSSLANGIYFISFDANGTTAGKKIIINR